MNTSCCTQAKSFSGVSWWALQWVKFWKFVNMECFCTLSLDLNSLFTIWTLIQKNFQNFRSKSSSKMFLYGFMKHYNHDFVSKIDKKTDQLALWRLSHCKLTALKKLLSLRRLVAWLHSLASGFVLLGSYPFHAVTLSPVVYFLSVLACLWENLIKLWTTLDEPKDFFFFCFCSFVS